MSVELVAPETLWEARQAIARPEAGSVKLLAGGTALVPDLWSRDVVPDTLVSLRRVRNPNGFTRVELHGQTLAIGGGVTLEAVSTSVDVRAVAPCLSAAARHVGNDRVRRVATLAGNLALGDAASDPAAALRALDADVVFLTADGELEQVPFAASERMACRLDAGDVICRVQVEVTGLGPSAFRRETAGARVDQACVVAAAVCRGNELIVSAGPATHGLATLAVHRPARGADEVGTGLAEKVSRIPFIGDSRAGTTHRRRLAVHLVSELFDEMCP